MKNKIFSALVVIAFGFTGCGGGGGGSAGTDTPATQTGTFIDAPVEGLEYSTPTLSGFTNANGEFQYKTGETITFKIGNLELGSATGGTTITPLTLAGDTDLNNIGTKATNIARILQTLDNNSTNGAKLVIPSSLRDLNISSSDFQSDSVLNEILTKAQIKTSVAYTLKDSIIARNEMKKYIGVYNEYDTIKAGYYSGTTSKYYLLTMPSSGNIIMSANWLDWGGGVMHLYDLNLNEVNFFDNDNAIEKDQSANVSAGTYVIKVSYPNNGGIISLNSPILFNQNNFTTLSNGQFSGTTTKYYLLTMPSSGNIIMSANWLDWGGGVMHLYDLNLNEVNFFDNDNAIEKDQSANVSAGTYVIKVSYPNNGGIITVNLPR